MTLTQLTFDQSWAGRIPPRWRWSRNKELLTESLALSVDGDEELLSVSHLTGITPRSEKTVTMTAAENLEGYRIVEPGDLVINTMWAWMGALGIAKQAGIVSPAYGVYSPRPAAPCEPRFYDYVYRSEPYVMEMTRLSRGIWSSRLRLYPDVFLSMAVPVPPLNEQRAIADYLDRETARIDTLIEEQQRLIEMLRERRQDLIRAAILGSANPFSPPAEAAFTAIGHHFSVTLGKMLDAGKAVRAEDRLLPYIRAGNIQDAGLKLDDVKEMPYSEAEAANLNLLKGDLLVVEGGAVGTNALVREDMPGWSFQKTVNRLRPLGNWSSAWLGYVLRTYRDIGVIDIVCNKSTIPHLTAEKLRAMRIPSVDPQEQVLVAARLDRQTIKIDVLIEETARFIELSRERRSALITAAVTGQFDVGEAA
ncbi:restriction endonuclease subunit S [Frankia sp. B2]|uniref:restriction endonuclease subunit S n=1 Tax=Frankia sp. B2 TaxID=2541730 RepID=UPI00106AE11A|nr:restriction endonuclease subunit S [Frankia sp. B2]TFE31177.1 restriction endonuclease subunit S [Frankia sp. B2]